MFPYTHGNMVLKRHELREETFRSSRRMLSLQGYILRVHWSDSKRVRREDVYWYGFPFGVLPPLLRFPDLLDDGPGRRRIVLVEKPNEVVLSFWMSLGCYVSQLLPCDLLPVRSVESNSSRVVTPYPFF